MRFSDCGKQKNLTTFIFVRLDHKGSFLHNLAIIIFASGSPLIADVEETLLVGYVGYVFHFHVKSLQENIVHAFQAERVLILRVMTKSADRWADGALNVDDQDGKEDEIGVHHQLNALQDYLMSLVGH